MGRTKPNCICAAAAVVLLALAAVSLFVGKYPLTLRGLLENQGIQRQVFWNLRFCRSLMGLWGGFCLGAAGFVFQTVFRNPLASPDIIGVSSGASAGAAAGILFLSSAAGTMACAFGGALLAVAAALALAGLDKSRRGMTIVLSGIAVQALAQTVLMALKRTADPERELASIEYWMMGSLSGVSLKAIGPNLLVSLAAVAALFALHRQVILLAAEEGEARMLGVHVTLLRLLTLMIATLAVACTISLTGLISFIGLLAPHIARMLTRDNRRGTLFLSGALGGILLCGADMLARSLTEAELPVSIFTSLLGAPFLIYLVVSGRKA